MFMDVSCVREQMLFMNISTRTANRLPFELKMFVNIEFVREQKRYLKNNIIFEEAFLNPRK